MRSLIIGLARPMLRLLGKDERGAVGVIVAVLIGGGVLTGMAAMVIDVGQLYQNRAELQNGADAAALAVAESCAEGTCQPSVAQGYATANASALTGGQAAIVQPVCGVVSGNSNGLPTCTQPTGGMVNCPVAPAGVANWVDVYTETGTPNSLLPPVFAETLLGNSGYTGSTVHACAQATWGPAGGAATFAMTISICTWTGLTGGTNFGPDTAIIIHGNGVTCKGPAGQNYPGGFDWLCPNTDGTVGASCNNNSSCATNISLTSTGPNLYTAQTSTGNHPPPPCNTQIPLDLNTVIYLPVFDGATTPQGHNTEYHIVGIAAFKLTGWKDLSTVSPKSDIPTDGVASQCPGNDACVFGEFTSGLIPPTSSINPPPPDNFGVESVQLIG
jgi:Flp pilus assembly protein TadG